MDETALRVKCLELARGLIVPDYQSVGGVPRSQTAGQLIAQAREFERYILDRDPPEPIADRLARLERDVASGRVRAGP